MEVIQIFPCTEGGSTTRTLQLPPPWDKTPAPGSCREGTNSQGGKKSVQVFWDQSWKPVMEQSQSQWPRAEPGAGIVHSRSQGSWNCCSRSWNCHFRSWNCMFQEPREMELPFPGAGIAIPGAKGRAGLGSPSCSWCPVPQGLEHPAGLLQLPQELNPKVSPQPNPQSTPTLPPSTQPGQHCWDSLNSK